MVVMMTFVVAFLFKKDVLLPSFIITSICSSPYLKSCLAYILMERLFIEKQMNEHFYITYTLKVLS